MPESGSRCDCVLLYLRDAKICNEIHEADWEIIGRITPRISEDIDAFMGELPSSDTWKEVNMYETMLQLVAVVTGRCSIGNELFQNKEYVENILGFVKDMMRAVRAVSQLSPWLRWWIAGALPDVKAVWRRVRKAEDMIQPVVKVRLESMKEGENSQKPDDLLQWLLESDHGKGFPREQLHKEITALQLELAIATIHTTTNFLANASVYSSPTFMRPLLKMKQRLANSFIRCQGCMTSRPCLN